jgi:hypothetical protein
MEWFLFAAPLPGAIALNLGDALSVIGGLATLAPAFLLARRGFELAAQVVRARGQRVINGGRELSRNPA